MSDALDWLIEAENELAGRHEDSPATLAHGLAYSVLALLAESTNPQDVVRRTNEMLQRATDMCGLDVDVTLDIRVE
jgi:hypothetical protein